MKIDSMMIYWSTLGLPMRAMATLSLLFMPPLYLLTDLSQKPLWNRLTLFRESSTAWMRECMSRSNKKDSSDWVACNDVQMTYS